jgi:hypothetical protein
LYKEAKRQTVPFRSFCLDSKVVVDGDEMCFEACFLVQTVLKRMPALVLFPQQALVKNVITWKNTNIIITMLHDETCQRVQNSKVICDHDVG